MDPQGGLSCIKKANNGFECDVKSKQLDQEKNADGAPPSSATTAELSASEGQTQGREPKILDVYKAPGVV